MAINNPEIDDLVQDCIIAITNTLDILQSYTKPLRYYGIILTTLTLMSDNRACN